MKSLLTALAATAFALAACTDAPTTAIPHSRAGPALDEVSSANEASHSLSTVRWNRTAIALFRARGGGAGRINAYLSLAQYRAILTAQDARHGTARPSLAAA